MPLRLGRGALAELLEAQRRETTWKAGTLRSPKSGSRYADLPSDRDTLAMCYMQADEATVLKVMESPLKLVSRRAASAVVETAEESVGADGNSRRLHSAEAL